jgi:hypothetical protein
MFKMMAGLDLLHVPYRGAQVLPALLAGDVPQVRSVTWIGLVFMSVCPQEDQSFLHSSER